MTDDNTSPAYRPRRSPLHVRVFRRARQALYEATSALGVNEALAATAWRQRRLLILCYHGVSLADEHEWSELYVSPAHLERRLSWPHRAGCAVLPLDEAVDALYGGRLPPRAVAVTFDDGTRDFALRAVPILQALDVPATVYLTTYHVRVQLPLFGTAFSYLLWKGAGRPFTEPGTRERLRAPASADAESRSVLQKRCADRARMQGLAADEKHAWLLRVAHELGQDLDAMTARGMFHLMTPEQVSSLDPGRIDVQLHTHRHLTPDDRAAFHREVTENRDAIRALCGARALRHFCYPSGRHTPEHVGWLRELGVTTATTCLPGLATVDTPPLLLPRLIDSDRVTDAKFAAWVHGTGHLVHRVATAMRPSGGGWVAGALAPLAA